jgi:hypothetical protein
MWDLTSVKKAESGGPGKVRPGRRASITALSSSSAGSEHGRIPCVGKVIPVFQFLLNTDRSNQEMHCLQRSQNLLIFPIWITLVIRLEPL